MRERVRDPARVLAIARYSRRRDEAEEEQRREVIYLLARDSLHFHRVEFELRQAGERTKNAREVQNCA